VTDAGLKHLAGLKELRSLHLYRTRITDAGLRILTGLDQMEFLNLYKTKITEAAAKKLEQAYPGLDVNR
jgi:hypothetical protein